MNQQVKQQRGGQLGNKNRAISKDQKRDKWLQIRISEQLQASIKASAKKHGLNISEYILHLYDESKKTT